MVALLYGGFCLVLLAALAMIVIPVLRTPELSLKQRYELAGTLFVFFFAAAYGIYYYLGAPEVIRLNAERELRIAQIRQLISQHSQIIKEQPENVDSWYILGQSFMQTGQYKGAVNALKQAVKLSNGNPQAILAYVGALVAEAEGRVTDDAKKGAEMVLVQEPKNPEAEYYLALHRMQTGDKEGAIERMRDIYYRIPDQSPVKPMIDIIIGNAAPVAQP